MILRTLSHQDKNSNRPQNVVLVTHRADSAAHPSHCSKTAMGDVSLSSSHKNKSIKKYVFVILWIKERMTSAAC